MVLHHLVLPVIYLPVSDLLLLGVVHVIDVHSSTATEVPDCEVVELLAKRLVTVFMTAALRVVPNQFSWLTVATTTADTQGIIVGIDL